MAVLQIEIIPQTWILGIRLPRDELRYYASQGWISEQDAEHLDRAFRRDAEGNAIILKHQLMVCLNKARKILHEDGVINKKEPFRFEIIDELGLPIGYVTTPKPFKTRAHVVAPDGTESTEYFEYLCSAHKIQFRVRLPEKDVQDFVKTIAFAGKTIGLGARGARGFGRFKALIGVTDSEGVEYSIEVLFKKKK